LTRSTSSSRQTTKSVEIQNGEPDENGIVRDKLAFDDNATLAQLSGAGGVNLKILEREVGLRIHTRGNELTLVGQPDQVELARTLLVQLHNLARRGRPLPTEEVVRAIHAVREDSAADVKEIFTDTVLVTSSSIPVNPKSLAQKRYIDAMRQYDIVFGIGPAGTGKTYLAMAMAVAALVSHQVKRIVLTRPAVEAGEKLGFLPGDLAEKVNPYLRPLYDALNDMMDQRRAQQLIERGNIEVAPLAFMRGRTLNSSFVILDEAQNCTSEQMMMFLTRLGFDSKAVVTGDITQTDLPEGRTSGLSEARQLLEGIEGIAFNYFTERDVVRHPLVQKIIKAYEAKAKPPTA
jgi:phosphate starvation-inducible protein PhoH and related proteins